LNPLPWFLQAGSQRVYRQPKGSYVVLDFETTALEFGAAINEDNKLILACWRVVHSDGTFTDKHKFGDEWDQDELLSDINNALFVVAHNAKFELQWLKRCGVNLRKVLPFCTMLGQWVLDGNLREPRSLQDLAKKYDLGAKGDVVSTLIKSGVCPSEIPNNWLLEYCELDVDLCHRLFKVELDLLLEKKLEHIVLTRNITCAFLADIEFEGMTLDNTRVEDEYDRTLREFNETKRRLDGLAEGVNFASGKQLAEYLFGTLKFPRPKDQRGNDIVTAKGATKTDAATLSLLVATTDEQREFLELYKRFNKLDSLLTKNLTYFKKTCEERQCKFLGIFNQGITATHRLSSSGRKVTFADGKTRSVQFQNMPRQYKGLFWAGDEDYLIGECDGAQLEFRVAAELGHDGTAYDEIVTGADVHAQTAAELTAAGEPTSRQDAKSRTFSPLYGGMGKTPAEKAYSKYFKEHYAGISKTQHEWALKVADKKYLTTPYGMVYYWPKASINRFGYVSHSTEIYNFPVQGLATAEIIPIAAVCFWHRSEGTGITVLNTIHDSLVNKVHKDATELFEELSKQCLTLDVYQYLRDIYNYEFTVPLGVGIKLARNWSDTKKEVIYQVFPNGKEERKEK